jgi:transcriptional regulator with XRE-family HTH domain
MITSDQIRVARALLRLEQKAVADKAGVSVSSMRRVESKKGVVECSPQALNSIRNALEAAGAEFIPAGVRRRVWRGSEEVEERLRAIAKISGEYQHPAAECLDTFFAEDDLYNESGLPA